MCKGCSNKSWMCYFVACAELSDYLDRLDYEIKKE